MLSLYLSIQPFLICPFYVAWDCICMWYKQEWLILVTPNKKSKKERRNYDEKEKKSAFLLEESCFEKNLKLLGFFCLIVNVICGILLKDMWKIIFSRFCFKYIFVICCVLTPIFSCKKIVINYYIKNIKFLLISIMKNKTDFKKNTIYIPKHTH